MTDSMDQETLKHLIRTSLESGDSSACGSCEVLKERSAGRGMLMRVTTADGESAIVKAWQIRNLKERMKSLFGVSMARREWRAHQHLERAEMPVPYLMLFSFVRCKDGRRFEAIVVEDLGTTTNGLVYLKDLLACRDDGEIHRFEDRVLALTSHLLQAGVVDVDHQLRNIVVNGTDRPTRIDFECARRFPIGRPPVDEYGRMIGRLVASHAFACQPELERSACFARRLAGYLNPPREVLHRAEREIQRALERQRVNAGIDSKLALSW